MVSLSFDAVLAPSRRTLVGRFTTGDGLTAPVVAVAPTITETITARGGGGSFALTIGGETVSIPAGSPAATVESLLCSLPSIGPGGITVAGIDPYVLTPTKPFPGDPAWMINKSTLVPGFDPTPGPDTRPGSGSEITLRSTDLGVTFEGTWTRFNNNPSGTGGAGYQSAPPGPLSLAVATYRVTVLPGTYQVSIAWPVDPGNAVDVPIRVYDGTTLRFLARVDQTQVPGISVYNSFVRHTVAQVFCGTGDLRVAISNDASAAVWADAVVITPVAGLIPYAISDDSANPFHLISGDCVFEGPGWKTTAFNAVDYGAQCHYALAGNGSNTATWRFPFLAPGQYEVQACWRGDPGYASASVYEVRDGVTVLGRSEVDQRVASTGGVATSGVTFQPLGIFNFSGGTATVVLTDLVSYGIVIADAILLRPLGSTPPIGTVVAPPIAVSGEITPYGGPPTLIWGGETQTLSNPVLVGDLVLYFLPAAVPEDVTPTISVPVYGITTAVGPVDRIDSQVVVTENPSVLAASTVPRSQPTMEIGYVVPQANYYSPGLIYADLMKQSGDWNGRGTFDSDGWPLTTQPNGVFSIVSQPARNGIDDSGLPNLPWGRYTLLWDTPDGTGMAWLSSSGSGDSYVEDFSGRTNSTANLNRVRIFNFTGNTSGFAAPSIAVWATGNCRNIRIFPPGVALDGSQLFHPSYLSMLAGARNLRMETFVQVNPAMVVDYTDFPSVTARSYAMGYGSPSVSLTAIVPAPGNETYHFFTPGRGIFVVTTSSPHNLKTGHIVQFSTNPNSAIVTLTNGETFDLSNFTPTICVLDATTFAASIPNPSPVAAVAYDGKGSAIRRRDASPPEHAVALVNVVPNATLHINVPHAMSDDGARMLFRMIALYLDRARSCRVELSNETWNSGFPYEQYAYFGYLGIQRGGLTNTQAYVQRSSEIQKIARDEFQQAGRSPSQIIGVFNSIALGSNVAAICDYAAKPTDPRAGGQPIPLDELAIAPYWRNFTLSNDSQWNSLTVDQAVDLLEVSLPGVMKAVFAEIRAALDSGGFPSTRMITYEGGPAAFFAGGDAAHLAFQSQGVNFHPRLFNLGLKLWREAQDAGCSCFTRQGVTSDMTSDVGVKGAACYVTYPSWNTRAAIGDGSDGFGDNRSFFGAADPIQIPPNYSRLVSPLGASINAWNQAAFGILEEN